MSVVQKVAWLGLAAAVVGTLASASNGVGPVEVLTILATGVVAWWVYRSDKRNHGGQPPGA